MSAYWCRNGCGQLADIEVAEQHKYWTGHDFTLVKPVTPPAPVVSPYALSEARCDAHGHFFGKDCPECKTAPVLSRNESGEAQPEGSQGASSAGTSPDYSADAEVRQLRREVMRLRKQMGEETVQSAITYDQSVQYLQNRCGDLVREVEQLRGQTAVSSPAAPSPAPESVSRPPASADALTDNVQGASVAGTSPETTTDAELRAVFTMLIVARDAIYSCDGRCGRAFRSIEDFLHEQLRARANHSEQARPQDAAATARRNND